MYNGMSALSQEGVCVFAHTPFLLCFLKCLNIFGQLFLLISYRCGRSLAYNQEILLFVCVKYVKMYIVCFLQRSCHDGLMERTKADIMSICVKLF